MCTTNNCTPYVLFGWVGAILVNIGFITLVTWGATTAWPLGFVLCFVYTIFLFCLARWFEDSPIQIQLYEQVRDRPEEEEILMQEVFQDDEEQNGESSNNSSSDNDGGEQQQNPQRPTKLPLTVSILYGLAVTSLWVSGLFFPVNLLPHCTYSRYVDDRSKSEWITNVSSLPTQEVQNWATASSEPGGYNSYAYIVDTQTTLFYGRSGDSYQGFSLLMTNSTSAPQTHSEYQSPDMFTVVNNNTACFSSTSSQYQARNVYCAKGNTIHSIVSPQTPLYELNSYLTHLKAFESDDATLWFKQYPQKIGVSGYLIFSLDVDSMDPTLYSRLVKKSDTSPNDCSTIIIKKALITLFTVALPITLTSIALWKVKNAPSMAVTTFIGFTVIWTTVYIMINPPELPEQWWSWLPWEWWSCLFGLVWLVALTYLNLTTTPQLSSVAKPPLQWGLVVSSLSFIIGTTELLPMHRDTFLVWFLLNILVFIPTLLIGMANSSMFLVFLGSIGFLADAARVSEFVDSYILSFLVFSMTGLLVGFIGYELTKYQSRVQNFTIIMIRQFDNVVFPSSVALPEQQTDENAPIEEQSGAQSSTGNHTPAEEAPDP